MSSISLCMIVKNEENVIERCINTVKDIVDEIIIVDTGSEDNTKEKIKKYNAKIYDFTWRDDFAAARNFAFSKASMDYILWLDADDVLEKKDQDKLKLLKKNINRKVDVVSMLYVLSADENNKPLVSLRRNRLVKREKNFLWIGKVHEYLDVHGNIMQADIAIRHLKDKEYTDRNLKIFRKMEINKEEFSPRDLFYYGNELYDNEFYIEAIEYYKKFINTDKGWIEDIKQAMTRISECYGSIGNKEKSQEYLFNTLKYDIPSSDLCCRIAYIFYEKEEYNIAAFWYELAINNKPNKESMSIVNSCMYTWVPALQLCVCYCKMGNFKKAKVYNEMAGKFVPNHSSVINNRQYLSDKI